MDEIPAGPHELWDEPWEGLPEEDAAWEWDLVDEEEDGPADFPKRYTRWYITYHKPTCHNVRISANRNPTMASGSTLTRLRLNRR